MMLASLIVAVGLTACRPPASVPEVSPPVSPAVPPAAPGATQPVPAVITFYDRDTGTTTATPVAMVPESIAWATVGGVRIAVVRIESSAAGGRREIFRYAGDGALLDTTVAGP